jgi:hypothetical protein
MYNFSSLTSALPWLDFLGGIQGWANTMADQLVQLKKDYYHPHSFRISTIFETYIYTVVS